MPKGGYYHEPALVVGTPSAAGHPEESRIITLVSSIPLAVDRAAYDLAEAAFVPQVVIKYTSLRDGAPATMKPAALMEAWGGIIPGFDATWYELGDVTVTIDGDTATASAFVDSRHWIGDRLWRPVGTYIRDLTMIGSGWRVTRMEFDMTGETGDRAPAAEAMERAR
ncbi:nuclear transport factor 2 family protein [Roseobacter ponti]|uniref:SnoaL-like domain-containing protein n=1 Tax=Roseobacter ponti TaxID=1891787 RepID=A0A858STW7_9RHOB|nr:nuclear transport factor 2 family protein [Roseobacter ponti]QJF50326.1 hypothetical protein G3256_03675 [Roseobacter ponti]